jgi:hypothetical protein
MRTLASILIVLFAVYVGAYFISVRPGVTITFGGWHTCSPDYRVQGMATIFSPLHQLDRQHLRSTVWAKPMTLAERRQIADLVLKHVTETLTPNKCAAANRRPAGQSDGSGNLSAIVAADRAFPAAVAELGR